MLEYVKVDSSAIFSFALKVMKLQVVVYGIDHNWNKMGGFPNKMVCPFKDIYILFR